MKGMSNHFDGYLNEPVYILVCRSGENINDDSLERIIMSVYSTEKDAILAKDYEGRRAKENGFGDYKKYYVEAWMVRKPT